MQVPERVAALSPSAGQDILVDPVRSVIYWIGSEGNDLKFINSSTGEIIDSIVVGSGPSSICLSTDGTVLYIPIPSYKCIIVVDVVSRTITNNISLTFTPFSVRLDGLGYMYVSGAGDNAREVYSINMGTWKVKNSEVVGFLGNLVIEISPDGSTLLAMELGISPHKIFRYGINAGVFNYQDVDNHDLGGTIDNEVVDWSRGKIYITSGYPYGIEVVSIWTLDYLGVYPMSYYPSCVAMSIDGKYIYGAHDEYYSGCKLWMFNATDGSLVGSIFLPAPIEHLAIAQDLKNAYIGLPIQRIPLYPVIEHLYPSSDSILGYTPSMFIADIQGGLPRSDELNATIHIDSAPLETYQYDMQGDIVYLRANWTEVLTEGVHSFNISVPWLDGIIWENTTFAIDRNSMEAIRPSVLPNSPDNGSIELAEPLIIGAYIVYMNFDEIVEGGWILLDGGNLSTVFDTGWLSANYSASPSLGVHNISAYVYWDGGLGNAWANWSFIVMQGPLLTPIYPAKDQVLTQLPNYVEVAIDGRDAGSNVSAPQIYIDEAPVLTTFTANGSMKAWITWTMRSGNHTGKATLDWTAGKIVMTWSFSVNVFVGPNNEILARHEYKDEFSLLVPEGIVWTLDEDSDISGEIFPLVLYGPTFSNFRTNIIVSSQSDPAIEETEAYLEDQLDQAIDELEQAGISAFKVASPELRTIDNHTALVGLVQLEGYSVYQEFMIIASEDHERMWVIIFSISMPQYGGYSEMFDLMIDSFEIEMEPVQPADSTVQELIGIGIAALAGGTAGAVVWLVRRRREPPIPE